MKVLFFLPSAILTIDEYDNILPAITLKEGDDILVSINSSLFKQISRGSSESRMQISPLISFILII